MKKRRECVFDLEADNLLAEVTTIWCGVFKDINSGEVFKFHTGQAGWKRKCMAFMDGCSTLIAHNGIGYDFPLLDKMWNYTFKGKKVDTLLMSRLHRPDRRVPFACPNKRAGPHSVEAWGYRLGRGKPEHEDWSRYSPEMLHRCSEDVEIQCLILKALKEERGEHHYTDAYNLTFKLFELLHKQEDYGWLVDKEYMVRCTKMLTSWIDRIDRVLVPNLPLVAIIEETKKAGEYNYVKKPFLKSGQHSASTVKTYGSRDDVNGMVGGPFSRVYFRPVNLNSGEEMKTYLLAEGWIPDKWNYKNDPNTGRPVKRQGLLVKTSPKLDKEDPFLGITGKVGKLCAKRIQVRHRRSNIEGWLGLIRADGRIASRVSGIASTGRMKHAGIVNVPNAGSFFGRQMRKCFTSSEGKVLVSVDADSCQNKMLGQRANSPELLEILLGDPHTLVKDAVNGVLERNGLHPITRGVAKNFGFAYRFGASDNKLGTMAGSAGAGGEIRDAIDEVFPAQAGLLEALTNEWKATASKRRNDWGKIELFNGSIIGLDGRPIRIASEHQILVYMLQSDEAIFMSASYCIAYKMLSNKYEYGKQFGIVCMMHDEFTIECDKDIADDVKIILEQSLTKASNHFNMMVCPQTGTADIGNTWLAVH